MLLAATAAQGPVLIMNTDCPALTTMHLRSAAKSLQNGAEVVLIPNETGGYVLIGLRRAEPTLLKTFHGARRASLTRLVNASSHASWCSTKCRRCGISPRKTILPAWTAKIRDSRSRQADKDQAADNQERGADTPCPERLFSTSTAITGAEQHAGLRNAATIAIGACVIAQIAMPYESTCIAPPTRPREPMDMHRRQHGTPAAPNAVRHHRESDADEQSH